MGKSFLTTPTMPNLSSPPSNPSIGDIYYDTSQGMLGVYTPSGWKYFPSSGGGGGARIFQTTIGDTSNSSYTVTHNLGTTSVEVSLRLIATNEKVGAKVVVLNSNQISVSFISPPGTNAVEVVVIG